VVGLMVIPYIDTNPKGNGYYTFKERWFAISTFLFGFLVLWISLIVLGTFFRGPGWNLFWPTEYWDPHKVVPLNNVDLNEAIAYTLQAWGLPWYWMLDKAQVFRWLVPGTFVAAGFGLLVQTTGHQVAFQERVWTCYWESKGAVIRLCLISLGLGGAAGFIAGMVGLSAVGVFLLVSVPVFLVGIAKLDHGFVLRVFEGAQKFKHELGPIRYYTVAVLYASMVFLCVKMAARLLFNIKYFVVLDFIGANI